MTRIYFVRHAQPDHRWQENSTRPLTETGRRDTAIVTEFFRTIPVDAFYSSPYVRSMETVAGAAAAQGKELRTDPRLRERQAGPGSNTREKIRRRWEDPDLHEEGGESLNMVARRNVEALQELLARHPEETLAIGTHGTALSTILHHYDPSFGAEDFFRIIDWMPYIIELDFEGSTLTSVREHCHMDRPFSRP